MSSAQRNQSAQPEPSFLSVQQAVTPLGLEPVQTVICWTQQGGRYCPLHRFVPMVREEVDPCALSLLYVAPISQPPGPANVENPADSDEVTILSPSAFQQAISSRRTRRGPVTDVEPARRQRRRLDIDPHQPNEGTSSSMLHVEPVAPPPPPSLPQPRMPTYTCSICLGPLVDATTTKCGHLFCERCIKRAITAQAKCPLCRHRISRRGLTRIYFPDSV